MNIIWFNPPLSQTVSTNVTKRFLDLLDKYSPSNNKLHKIFNRNTVKVSYFGTPSVGFLQLCNHNQVAQHQQSNRSGLHYFIAQLKIYQKWLLHSVIAIQGPLLAHCDHAAQMCQAYIAPKALFPGFVLITPFVN